MKYRAFGKTSVQVSEISLGTWQLGGKWGDAYSDKIAQATMETAFEQGINFFDTADVYNGGGNEKRNGRFLKRKQGKKFFGTQSGREINPPTTAGHTRAAVVE